MELTKNTQICIGISSIGMIGGVIGYSWYKYKKLQLEQQEIIKKEMPIEMLNDLNSVEQRGNMTRKQFKQKWEIYPEQVQVYYTNPVQKRQRRLI